MLNPSEGISYANPNCKYQLMAFYATHEGAPLQQCLVSAEIANGTVHIDIELNPNEDGKTQTYYCQLRDLKEHRQLAEWFDSTEEVLEFLTNDDHIRVDLEQCVLRIVVKPFSNKEKHMELARLQLYESRKEAQNNQYKAKLENERTTKNTTVSAEKVKMFVNSFLNIFGLKETKQAKSENIDEHSSIGDAKMVFPNVESSSHLKAVEGKIAHLEQRIDEIWELSSHLNPNGAERLSNAKCEQCFDKSQAVSWKDNEFSSNLCRSSKEQMQNFVDEAMQMSESELRHCAKDKRRKECQQYDTVRYQSEHTNPSFTSSSELSKVKTENDVGRNDGLSRTERLFQLTGLLVGSKEKEQYSQVPSFIDPTSAFAQCFRFDGRQITLVKLPIGEERRAVMIIGSASIAKQSVFKFKIVKCNPRWALGFGIVDARLRGKRFCKSGENCVRLSNKLTVFNGKRSWKHSQGAISEGQTVTMKVDVAVRMVEWLVDSGAAFSCTNFNIATSYIRWVPFVEIRKIGDTIEWVQ